MDWAERGLTWAERSSPRATGGQQPHRVTREDKDHKTPGQKHSPVSTAGTAQTVIKIQVDEGGVRALLNYEVLCNSVEYELNRFHTL